MEDGVEVERGKGLMELRVYQVLCILSSPP